MWLRSNPWYISSEISGFSSRLIRLGVFVSLFKHNRSVISRDGLWLHSIYSVSNSWYQCMLNTLKLSDILQQVGPPDESVLAASYYTPHQGDWTSVVGDISPILYWQKKMGGVYQIILPARSIKEPGLSAILIYSLDGLKLGGLNQ